MSMKRQSVGLAGLLGSACLIGSLATGADKASIQDQQSLSAVRKSLAARQGAHAKIIDAQKELSKDRDSLTVRQKQELQELNVTPKELEDSTAPWEMFAKSLRQLYNNDPAWTGMQVLGLPMAADWDDATLGKWRKWRVYGDTIPKWGSSYIPTGLQVTRGYEAFIENIAIPQPNPADQKAANKAQEKFNDENRKLQDLWNAVGPDWKIFDAKQQALPPERRMTFDDWFAKFDGFSGSDSNRSK
jgi:hypothetical protein